MKKRTHLNGLIIGGLTLVLGTADLAAEGYGGAAERRRATQRAERRL